MTGPALKGGCAELRPQYALEWGAAWVGIPAGCKKKLRVRSCVRIGNGGKGSNGGTLRRAERRPGYIPMRRAACRKASACGTAAETAPNRGFSFMKRRCYSLWLFHLHSMVKIQPFSPVFPLAGSTVKAFCRLFLWSFKEKTSTIFYNIAICFRSCRQLDIIC